MSCIWSLAGYWSKGRAAIGRKVGAGGQDHPRGCAGLAVVVDLLVAVAVGEDELIPVDLA